jgi:hypothetical protein
MTSLELLQRSHWEQIPVHTPLSIAGIIPRAWLVQIKDAGHVVRDPYPVEISNILNTFQSTASPNN